MVKSRKYQAGNNRSGKRSGRSSLVPDGMYKEKINQVIPFMSELVALPTQPGLSDFKQRINLLWYPGIQDGDAPPPMPTNVYSFDTGQQQHVQQCRNFKWYKVVSMSFRYVPRNMVPTGDGNDALIQSVEVSSTRGVDAVPVPAQVITDA